MAKPLSEGDRAPSFNLVSDSGERVSLSSLKGRNVILYFYPKDSTPGCTQEACDFTSAFPRFKRADAVILGVSKDSVESHVKFKDKYKISIPLLSDPKGEACEAYGVWQEKSLYGRKFMGIVRSTFVIDPKGRISRVFAPVKVKGHADAVLEALTLPKPSVPANKPKSPKKASRSSK